MLYVGIDLHLKQLTVCIRDEQGQIVLRRQVSTRPGKIRQFLDELGAEDGYIVILEVCGFHEWLVRILREESACRDVVLIQATIALRACEFVLGKTYFNANPAGSAATNLRHEPNASCVHSTAHCA